MRAEGIQDLLLKKLNCACNILSIEEALTSWKLCNSLDLGGDGLPPALATRFQGSFICSFAGFEYFLLLFIKVIQGTSILCPPIVALPHALRWVMGFPEPTQDIDEANLGWVEDNLHKAPTTAPVLDITNINEWKIRQCESQKRVQLQQYP